MKTLPLLLLLISHGVSSLVSADSSVENPQQPAVVGQQEYSRDSCIDINCQESPEASLNTPLDYRTPSPTTESMDPTDDTWDVTKSHGVDILVAAFFLVATGWLLIAIIYSCMVLFVLRLRARGDMDVFDEDFGRFYLFGSRRCYIPLGCLLRRYVVSLEEENPSGSQHRIRYMTRSERRAAIDAILNPRETDKKDSSKTSVPLGAEDVEEKPTESTDDMDLESPQDPKASHDENSDDEDEEPACSICLGEYETYDIVFSSETCSHQFHRECIFDWLSRRNNTECPCCRQELVDEDAVWKAVRKMRKEKRRKLRRERRKRRQERETEEVDETEEPSSSSSDGGANVEPEWTRRRRHSWGSSGSNDTSVEESPQPSSDTGMADEDENSIVDEDAHDSGDEQDGNESPAGTNTPSSHSDHN